MHRAHITSSNSGTETPRYYEVNCWIKSQDERVENGSAKGQWGKFERRGK